MGNLMKRLSFNRSERTKEKQGKDLQKLELLNNSDAIFVKNHNKLEDSNEQLENWNQQERANWSGKI